jgi:hypothetical protein
MSQPPMERTRKDLHAVAELLLAGPQYRRSGTIRLRAVPGGFGTVAEPELSVQGTDLVLSAGDAPLRLPLNGARIADLAREAGIVPGPPQGVYSDTTGADPDRALAVDPDAAGRLAEWFSRGATALSRFSPQTVPVLWPEHFDLGIAVDEVNYGVSPGDSDNTEPYAYIGPWTPRTGDFWTASFGASRPASALGSEDALLEFFEQGRRAAASG